MSPLTPVTRVRSPEANKNPAWDHHASLLASHGRPYKRVAHPRLFFYLLGYPAFQAGYRGIEYGVRR